MTNVYYACIDAPEFRLYAVGASAAQARDAVLNAWRAHATAVGADPSVRPEDIHMERLVLGQGYHKEGQHKEGQAAQPLGEPATAEGMNTARIVREGRASTRRATR